MARYEIDDLTGAQVETNASVVERLSSVFVLNSDDINIIEPKFCCWQSVEGQEYAECVWVKFDYSGDRYVATVSWDEFDKLYML